MKITANILSIPPYLSTTWKNISSLHVEGERLIVLLQNGTSVEVPGLSSATIEEIFDAHARSTEEGPIATPLSFSLPLNGSIGSAMQHNPEQAELPPLPPEMLKKITTIARAFGVDDSLPTPESNCNCIYCQIARSLNGEQEQVEEVSDEDLKFRNWEIAQVEEKLYTVTNPLDPTEHYNVFLGSPIGCTCGSKECEHIRAVLHS